MQRMRSVSAPSDVTEVEKCPETVRRALPNEADELQVRSTQLQNAFHRLTPELSRAERGGWEPVLPAFREVSTKPRHGVGLNDLLGGKEAGEGEAFAGLPKGRSPDA
jgi:hypothetical protein